MDEDEDSIESSSDRELNAAGDGGVPLDDDDDSDDIEEDDDEHDGEEADMSVGANETYADDDDNESIVDEDVRTENADDDEEDNSVKSNEDDGTSMASSSVKTSESKPERKRGQKRKGPIGGGIRKGRTPSVKGLTIPFRTVKKAMKLDPDTPIVQNEAAIMTTFAVELFLQKLTQESFTNARNRGRNTVRYEDIAEARTNYSNLSFLETIFP